MTPVKLANTCGGWAIALLSGEYRDGSGTYFDVVRVSPDNKYVTLHTTPDPEKARALANREWLAEMTA